jgi:hypothetical protein
MRLILAYSVNHPIQVIWFTLPVVTISVSSKSSASVLHGVYGAIISIFKF